MGGGSGLLNIYSSEGKLLKQVDKNVSSFELISDEEVEESPEGVVNPYMSGMYYIDSIEFEYVTEKHKIQQYLYLIKRSIDKTNLLLIQQHEFYPYFLFNNTNHLLILLPSLNYLYYNY